jgi:hypothetical protein
LGAAEPRYVLQSPGLVENCVRLYVPLLEFNLDGKNACPPEDCGGIWGYYDLLKAVKNPKHKEHQETLDCLGGQFDPGHFDLQKINAALRGLEI